MEKEQIIEVLAKYNLYLENKGVKIVKDGSQLEHCRYMCQKVLDMINSKEWDHNDNKVHRWLGFIQGVLYANSIFSIDEMRNHNK